MARFHFDPIGPDDIDILEQIVIDKFDYADLTSSQVIDPKK